MDPKCWFAFFGGIRISGGSIPPAAWFAFLATPPAVPARVPLETAIKRYFSADTAIATLTADPIYTARVFLGRVPQKVKDATPSLVYRVITRTPINELSGESGIVVARVQFNSKGGDAIEAEALQYAVRCAAKKIPYLMGGLIVTSAWIDDGDSADDALPGGSDSTRADYRTDLMIQYLEPLV